jgi:hypothetical protein
VPALAAQAAAVGILEFDVVMVKNLAIINAFAHLASAHAPGFDRVALLDPIDDIQVVDVLLVDVIAAQPDEIIPIAHLVFHFRRFAAELFFQLLARASPRRPGCRSNSAHGDNVADGAIVQPLDGFQIRLLMMPLQADGHLEILLLGLLGGGQHLAHAGAIDRHRFLHENMFALAHRFLEMGRSKSGRRGQNHDIRQRDGMLIGVESDEFVLFRHIHAVGVIGLEFVVAAVQAVFESVGHGDQFEGAGGAEGLAAAPLPRPPQPISATFSVSSPAAKTPGARLAAAARVEVVLRKLRRVSSGLVDFCVFIE